MKLSVGWLNLISVIMSMTIAVYIVSAGYKSYSCRVFGLEEFTQEDPEWTFLILFIHLLVTLACGVACAVGNESVGLLVCLLLMQWSANVSLTSSLIRIEDLTEDYCDTSFIYRVSTPTTLVVMSILLAMIRALKAEVSVLVLFLPWIVIVPSALGFKNFFQREEPGIALFASSILFSIANFVDADLFEWEADWIDAVINA